MPYSKIFPSSQHTSKQKKKLELWKRLSSYRVTLGLLLVIFLWTFIYLSSEYGTDSQYKNNLRRSFSSPQVQNALREAEEVYRKYKKKREGLVGNPENVRPWEPHIYPYDYFVATFTCPFSVQRVGAIGDGGKWICGLELYKETPCILYSFGLSSEVSFELEILQTTSCHIYAYDASVDNLTGIPAEFRHRITFYQKFLGTEDSPEEFISLRKAMESNGHTHIDILKMDVEGKEYEIFEELVKQFRNQLSFLQLLIEVHANITDGKSFAKLYRFFERLESAGLRPFRNELNISPMVVDKVYTNALSEYSFLNLNFLGGENQF